MSKDIWMDGYQLGFIDGLEWALNYALREDLYESVDQMRELLQCKIEDIHDDIREGSDG